MLAGGDAALLCVVGCSAVAGVHIERDFPFTCMPAVGIESLADILSNRGKTLCNKNKIRAVVRSKLFYPKIFGQIPLAVFAQKI